jgi:formimidoylglutamate deiminase
MEEDNPNVAKYFRFRSVLMKDGWLKDCIIGVDLQGNIVDINTPKGNAFGELEIVNGYLLPGFQNAHSHAFQYAMAGMAETHQLGSKDDFWTWREAMYKCALSLDPDEIQIVATALYIELLKRGYTNVAEFHYLHHDKNGKAYSNAAEISVSLLAAAATAGINITLIPVFYQKGGFGKEAEPRQKRFIFQDTDVYFRLLEQANDVVKTISTARLGFGVHSLRAAHTDDIQRVLQEGPQHLPFHLHAAEQLKEVNECVEYLHQRPVEWILNNLSPDDRFSIVHCTHLNNEEVNGLARSKANVVLCPGTEGNLGDGIFKMTEFAQAGGNFCIGTDSHISINPLEDLRWIDYAQRLTTHKRNTFNDGGFTMVSKGFFSGSAAMGAPRDHFFEIGKPLNGVVYRSDSFLLQDDNDKHLLPRILFNSDSEAVYGTLVNGKWVIKHHFHSEEENVKQLFLEVVKSLDL